jgi:hypothetical protein
MRRSAPITDEMRSRLRRMGSFHAQGEGDAGSLGATIPPTRAITTIARCARETADELFFLKNTADALMTWHDLARPMIVAIAGESCLEDPSGCGECDPCMARMLIARKERTPP